MNILLVEDHAMLAAALRERARQKGLALDHAGDADGADLLGCHDLSRRRRGASQRRQQQRGRTDRKRYWSHRQWK
ncbi:hypothetical protein FPK48_32315 [Acinetobacter baumannii]|nr:hypothetical protein [Acinetobacter baumannii]